MAIHHILTDSLKRLQERFAADERCLGMYLWGSLANSTADDWSDVDVAAVFRDEDYAAVKEELRAICQADCGDIVVWLPEGDVPGAVNDAFLFQAEGRLHLYDFTIHSVTYLAQTKHLRPERILFDRTGILAATAAERQPAATFKPSELPQLLNCWWVYTYLNGKYYKRGDAFKMLYVQQVIFQMHMKVLHASYPDARWHWWARDVHALPAAQQDELLVYFGATQPVAIAQALRLEMDLFSRDAQAACRRWDVPYPAELERAVRGHLSFMGLTPPP